MPKVFISYRREDSAAFAGRLADHLREALGEGSVFMDVDSLRPGEDFPQVIEQTVRACDVLLAVVGRDWFSAADTEGRRRLDDPGDFVRLEIATALRYGVAVIPVLVGGASMPEPEELPDDLSAFAHRHAARLDSDEFREDVQRLLRRLPRSPARRRVLVVLGAGLLLLSGGVAWFTLPRGPTGSPPRRNLRSEPATISWEAAQAMLVGQGFFAADSNPGGPGIAHQYEQRTLQGALAVIDSATGLMWLPSPGLHSFSGALQSVRAINSQGAAGYSDWRLPTLEEATALMEPQKSGQFHLSPMFGFTPFIWTADSLSPEQRWVVYYGDGICDPETEQFNAHVLAVRTVSAPR